MLPLSHRIAFSIFALVTVTLGARGFYRVYLRIRRGRDDADQRRDHLGRRLWYALRTTLLQERVFRARRVLSVFHSFIFYAFVLYLLVNALDAVDGFVPLRTSLPAVLSGTYGVLTDAFSVLAIVGVVAFVLRRFVFRSRQDFGFNELTHLDAKVRRGYIQRDSVIVAAFILFHVGSRIIGNAARLAVEGGDRAQPFASMLARAFAGPHALAWRIFGYWGALGSVLLFLVYFPYSKHIHLIMAPVKYFFRREAPSGELPAAHIDLEAAEPEVGAERLAELSWPRLLDAYACIQCNRCQDVCPATRTGKALSPSALEINKRMVLNSIAEDASAFSLRGATPFERGVDAGPKLMEAVISPEAVWACTTCGACMEVCPTQDEQMLDIIDIRRNAVMVQGEFPAPLQTAFRGMERAGNPWGIAREKRMAWAEGLRVPTVEDVPEPDVLYWVGCAASYDPGAQKTARAVVQLLAEGGVKFAVLGKRETCTGDSARRAGNELLYGELARTATTTLNEVKPKLVIASCPHCVNTISREFPQFGGNFNVMHHSEYLASMLDEGRLKPASSDAAVTFHDPCYLGRHRGTYEQPRAVVKSVAREYVELPRTKNNAFCCGAGGAQFWKEEERGTERISENRFREVQQTLGSAHGEKVLAVGCPFCKSMLQSTPAAGADGIAVKDVAELLWEGVQRAKSHSVRGPTATEVPVLVAVNQALDVPHVASVMPAALLVEQQEQVPEGVMPVAEAQSQDAVTSEPTEAVTTPTPARKKWAPRTSSAAPSSPDVAAEVQVANEVEQTKAAGPDLVQKDSQPMRKKWQPKSK